MRRSHKFLQPFLRRQIMEHYQIEHHLFPGVSDVHYQSASA